jgi:hypothetical protein
MKAKMIFGILMSNLLMAAGFAQGQNVPPAEKEKTSDSLPLTKGQLFIQNLATELRDELYPNPYFKIQSRLATQYWYPNYAETEEFYEAEKAGIKDARDALRHTVVQTLKESPYLQDLMSRWEGKFGLTLSAYYDRPLGVTTQKKFYVDAEIQAAEIRREEKRQRNEVDFGLRLRHLDDPGIFLRYDQQHNSQKGPRHELLWQPVEEKVSYSLRRTQADFRLEYDYDKENLTFRFLNLPFGQNLGPEAGGHFLLFHNFNENDSGIEGGFYIRF